MESDILRLVLLVFGAASVLSIYAWDRMRRRNRDESSVMAGFDAESTDILLETEAQDNNTLTTKSLKVAFPSLSAKQPVTPQTHKTTIELNSKKVFPANQSKANISSIDKTPEKSPQLRTEVAHDLNEAPPSIKTPEKIISLSIVAGKGHLLAGKLILQAVEKEKLHYGDMKIFHRLDEPSGENIFSMVNMVEPGYFNLDTLEQTQLPGITFFLRLPGQQSGMAMFSDMLFTIERFATTLQGEVVDSSQVRLTKTSLTDMQDEIIRFERECERFVTPM